MIGCQLLAFTRSSAKYCLRNSFHFLASCPNHLRKRSLGAASLSQPSSAKLSFFKPLGQSRSTRKRLPSFAAGSSYTRLTLIIEWNPRDCSCSLVLRNKHLAKVTTTCMRNVHTREA